MIIIFPLLKLTIFWFTEFTFTARSGTHSDRVYKSSRVLASNSDNEKLFHGGFVLPYSTSPSVQTRDPSLQVSCFRPLSYSRTWEWLLLVMLSFHSSKHNDTTGSIVVSRLQSNICSPTRITERPTRPEKQRHICTVIEEAADLVYAVKIFHISARHSLALYVFYLCMALTTRHD